MKSMNKKSVLLVSASVILLCMTIIVGMTWALFTDTQKVTNHLQAGDLAITLKRTELIKTTLNAQGKLVTSEPDTTPLTFSNPADENVNPADENVFGIGENEKIVPGAKYVAKMQIENHSDVAFGYWIEIVCTDKTNGANLAKQLKVTVNTGTGVDAIVNDGLMVGSDKNFVDVLEIDENGTFTVTVEFVDEGYSFENGVLTSKNDAAETENLKFDLIVYAIQAKN